MKVSIIKEGIPYENILDLFGETISDVQHFTIRMLQILLNEQQDIDILKASVTKDKIIHLLVVLKKDINKEMEILERYADYGWFKLDKFKKLRYFPDMVEVTLSLDEERINNA